jgi:hypothetical protein
VLSHRMLGVVALAAVLGMPSVAAASFIGPTPYLGFSDSPFSSDPFAWFHLEDFEDGLNTPGANVGPASVVLAVAGYTDSVDADDGSVDGSGSGGHSLWSNFSTPFMEFTFSAAALGAFPTHVGVVWTDVGQVFSGSYGAAATSFEAFDENNNSLGVIGPFVLGDGAIAGETAEDRFLGAINNSGISQIRIFAPDTFDWEVDHLQYGLRAVQSVPEPASTGLLLTGCGWLLARNLRRRRSSALAQGSGADQKKIRTHRDF